MTKPEPSVSVTRDINAPVSALFDCLARPALHASIDGSGMLRGTEEGQLLARVGDVFEMRMCNDLMGDYLIENLVVEFEAGRRIAWEPVVKATANPEFHSRVGDRSHLRWGWDLSPLPDGRTRVTEFYDLSAAPQWVHDATNEGENWRPAMEASLTNLAKLVGAAG